jgi:hypothetical protein
MLYIVVALVGMTCFGLTILFAIASDADKNIIIDSPFKIETPGLYMLWTNKLDKRVMADQFIIVGVNGNEIIKGHSPSESEKYRENGDEFIGACEFQFVTAGLYRLFAPNYYNNYELRLGRHVMSNSSLGLSAIGFFFFLLASVYLLWKNFWVVRGANVQLTDALFSSLASIRVYGQGTSARADWPFGSIGLGHKTLTLNLILTRFQLSLNDIDCIKSGWLGIVITHHASNVPSGIRIWGFSLSRRLRETIQQYQLPVRMT